MSIIQPNAIKKKATQSELSFSGKELDWLLRKMSDSNIKVAEIEIANSVMTKLINKHKEIINAQHSIETSKTY